MAALPGCFGNGRSVGFGSDGFGGWRRWKRKKDEWKWGREKERCNRGRMERG